MAQTQKLSTKNGGRIARSINPAGTAPVLKLLSGGKVKNMATTKKKKTGASKSTAPAKHKATMRSSTAKPKAKAKRASNPSTVAKASPKAKNPGKSRVSNPMGGRIGSLMMDTLVGTIGAIAARGGTDLIQGLVVLPDNKLARPVVTASLAVFVTGPLSKRLPMLGRRSDLVTIGGLVAAGLEAADAFIPDVAGRLRARATNLANSIRGGVSAPVAGLAGYYDTNSGEYFPTEDELMEGGANIEGLVNVPLDSPLYSQSSQMAGLYTGY